MNKKNMLEKIVAVKQQEVDADKQAFSKTQHIEFIQGLPAPRNFTQALQHKVNEKQAAIIAEIKKASPSKGLIRENFDPVAIAKSYQQHGACCLSVLTDTQFFQGSKDDLINARNACDLPVIRKDFIVDTYQIYQSRSIGADCILLIAAILDNEKLQDFYALATQLDLSVLIEVHDQTELERALNIPCPLIGINNRNLKDFDTSLQTTYTLAPQIPNDRVVISESGIHHPDDVKRMMERGIYSFLVGESLMRQADPGIALASLITNQ